MLENCKLKKIKFHTFHTFTQVMTLLLKSSADKRLTVNFHYSHLEATFGTKFIKIRDNKFCASSWRLLHSSGVGLMKSLKIRNFQKMCYWTADLGSNLGPSIYSCPL